VLLESGERGGAWSPGDSRDRPFDIDTADDAGSTRNGGSSRSASFGIASGPSQFRIRGLIGMYGVYGIHWYVWYTLVCMVYIGMYGIHGYVWYTLVCMVYIGIYFVMGSTLCDSIYHPMLLKKLFRSY